MVEFRSRGKLSFWSLILCVFFSCDSGQESDTKDLPIPGQVSYDLHVRSILSDNCFACHGPDANKREAGLRLDIAEEAYKALKENPNSHAIVPGYPQASAAYLRMTHDDPSEVMPPTESNLKLTQREIQLIKKWIEQGAEYEPHWAFVAPKKMELPAIEKKIWPTNELDFFILEQLEEMGLEPNPAAGKEMILRRLCFDITGLPPNLELMDAFLKDESENAYEKTVDKLLEEETYGEKMAVHWMDISRYADSHGYQDDYYRTQWPWRDWVIHAFNKNMPYDRFVTWQLAGDLLPGANKEQLLATGFNRNHKITEESGAIDEEYRVSYVVDRTNTVGKALLAVTMECAQCHDHKYDPISQKEYFQLYAFFNNVAEFGIEESSNGFSKKSTAKYPLLEITDQDVAGILSFVNKPDSALLVRPVLDIKEGANFNALASEAAKLKVSVMGDLDTLRKSYILERGDYESHGEEVSPNTPEQILYFKEAYPKNRLGLSQWIFDKENPLPARVFVNRIWQSIFGRGLVSSPGDFGMQGELPSHPGLLDWLAVDFMENGWDIKRLIKQIVLSSTYRQSSKVDEKKWSKDPENIYLSRFPRNRLPAEHIRDLVLSSSGLLQPVIGGPSVKPYQPPGLWELASSGRGNTAIYKQDTGQSLYRRGLYTFVKRTVPPPSLILFDASNRDECEVERNPTNTPLQALFMMNDITALEASRVLAAKLLQESSQTEGKIRVAFARIVNRNADGDEIQVLLDFYQEQLEIFEKSPLDAEKVLKVGEYPQTSGLNIPKHAALMQVISLIYNLEETITKS